MPEVSPRAASPRRNQPGARRPSTQPTNEPTPVSENDDASATNETPISATDQASQTPNPHRRRISDRAPSAPPDGDPTTPPAETTPPRPPRRRRTAGDRRTTIDARTQPVADETGTLTVIVQPRDFRLPNVLRHIEAGKIVLVIPQNNDPD